MRLKNKIENIDEANAILGTVLEILTQYTNDDTVASLMGHGCYSYPSEEIESKLTERCIIDFIDFE